VRGRPEDIAAWRSGEGTAGEIQSTAGREVLVIVGEGDNEAVAVAGGVTVDNSGW
jgi:hypothetical protein